MAALLQRTRWLPSRRGSHELVVRARQIGGNVKGTDYPAVKELGTKKTEEMVPEAYEEHHVAKLVIGELPKVDPDDERFQAKMTVLE
jgi:hypothetical protein